MLMILLLCLGQAQPETFAVVPLKGDKYSAERVKNEILSSRLDLGTPEMLELALYCQNQGKAITNDEVFKIAFTSKDFTHRAGAAFYFGYKKQINDDLWKLMHDEHPLVILAAKSSCISVAKSKSKQDVDFGPNMYNIGDKESVETSIRLWKSWFDSKDKTSKYSNAKLSSNK